MNGYYRRKSSLPYEEIRPLEFDEIEFVSDVGEGQEEDLLRECLICGEEVGLNEDEEILDDEESFCERCCRYTVSVRWACVNRNCNTQDTQDSHQRN